MDLLESGTSESSDTRGPVAEEYHQHKLIPSKYVENVSIISRRRSVVLRFVHNEMAEGEVINQRKFHDGPKPRLCQRDGGISGLMHPADASRSTAGHTGAVHFEAVRD